MFVPLTPLDFKHRAVCLFGRKVGVVDGEKRFTYREFGLRTQQLGNALLDRGLQPGDRVAFLAYNSYPLLEGYYGVLEAGGILLPINIRLKSNEIAYILNHSHAAFLLADPDFDALVQEMRPHLEREPQIIWLSPRSDESTGELYDEVLAASSTDVPARPPIDENDVAELFYTSGTTGFPKGVMLTHRNLYLHAMSVLASSPVSDADVQLHTIPLFHVNGWGTPQLLTAMGGTHVMMRKFEPSEALRLIEVERVTRLYAVPTMINMMLNHPDLERYDHSSLQLILSGGAPTPPDMIRRVEQLLGCEVMGGYGLSETTPVLTVALPKASREIEDEALRVSRRASAGIPLVGVDLRVVNDDGSEVAHDGIGVGEIVVRSNVVMKGYLDDHDATAAATRDGWFHTGDIGTIDDEGYVLVVDRKKDIIISGGENISSVEIEKVLYEHPAVLESAVIGVPDANWGEVPIAVVALRPDSDATEMDLISYCRARIAGYKVPKAIKFVESLPKGGTGKVLKRELREPYWEGHAKRVH